MRKISKKGLSITLFVVLLAIFSSFNIFEGNHLNNPNEIELSGDPTFENNFFKTDITSVADLPSDIIKFDAVFTIINDKITPTYDEEIDEDIASDIASLVGSKRVGISSAQDLYNLSISAAYNFRYPASPNSTPYSLTIAKVLDLDYVLLSDIDYSVMKGQRFIPLGIDFEIEIDDNPENNIHYDFPFTGSFDGQGFTIKNLYLADYDYITTIFRIGDDETTDVDLPVSSYYSMFNKIGFNAVDQDAVVKNFVLVDPIMILLDAPEGVFSTSYLVGENNGMVYNVGIVDKKLSQFGEDNSGIRFTILYQQTLNMVFSAGGFVHTNNPYGKIYNSYFTSNNVIVPESTSIFKGKIKPFYYNNLGSIIGAAYEAMDISQGDIASYTVEELQTGIKNSTAIVINSVDLGTERHKWHFYDEDGYPQLFGLDFKNNYYEINDAHDLMAFGKMINLKSTSPDLGIKYYKHNYKLLNNIDMASIENYQTPIMEFQGSLIGGSADFTAESNEDAKYIYNLKIKVPAIIGSEYYLGFLGQVSGTINNIIFYNNEVVATNTKEHYGKKFYIGTVAAKTNNANLKNIISNSTIDLGEEAIGSTDVGGIVGHGNGVFYNIAHIGTIDGNTHNFEGLLTDGKYNIGGIVGASATGNLQISHSVNKGAITGIASDANFSVQTNDFIKISIGGIIGEVNNQSTNGNSIYYVTNDASIIANSFYGKESALVYQHLGGIFGSTINNGYILSKKVYDEELEEDVDVIVNGRWENLGNVAATHLNQYTFYYTAGIGVANTSSTLANFSYMINNGGYDFTGFTSATHNTTMFYAAIIIDNSSAGIKLSRAYNEKTYTYDQSYFVTTTNIIKIAPFYTSINDVGSELVYCQNNGNLIVGNTTNYINTKSEMRISGITQAANVNYRNVYQVGDITVTKVTQEESVYVAGIAWILPYVQDTSTPYTADNLVNEGKIVTADFNGNTIVISQSGTSASATSFSSNFTFSNLYVAGLFNINVGEIRNSLNRGDITSTGDSVSDIKGSANTFVGGIVTFNYNYIQDCGNMGDIYYYNSFEVTSGTLTFVVGGITPSSSSTFGGLVFAYRAGITLGGIAAALVDNSAKVLETTIGDTVVNYGRATIVGSVVTGGRIIAKIEDTANKGNIYGKSEAYVRCGGILGVALGTEITAGTDNNSSSGGFAKYSYIATGATDPIGNFILSNGLNFGNIIAITKSIGSYPGNIQYFGSTQGDSYATAKRPGIYSCAGGVIGYGLCGMIRMLNHGIVIATDVAGGIIGATYIIGKVGSSTSNLPVTLVNINTAVHYGKVVAAKKDEYSDINYTDVLDEIDLLYDENPTLSLLYNDENSFMFPVLNNGNSLALYPNNKRGFGGIFGRLQRGYRGIMQSNNFINIMNMDPNVDLIGRADQGSYTSYYYYRFSVGSQKDSYYTARINDTTPIAFSGYYETGSITRNFTSTSSVTFRIRRYGSNYFVNAINNVTGGYGTAQTTNGTRTVGVYKEPYSDGTLHQTDISGSTRTDSFYGYFVNYNLNSQYPLPSEININSFDFTDAQRTIIRNASYNSSNYSNVVLNGYTGQFSTGGVSNVPSQHIIEQITDDESAIGTYIFGEDFPLMDEEGQSDYIFPAEADALAPGFTNKPNGMYILASSKASEAGVALPGNIKIDRLYKLDESNEYIDLDIVPYDKLIDDGEDVDDLIEDYESMFQLSFNEKSLVLTKDEAEVIADLILYDPDGVSPTLQSGEITNVNKETNTIEITYTLPNDAFTSTDLYYEVYFATLSEDAVIAKVGIDNSNLEKHNLFRAAYDSIIKTSNIMGEPYKAIMEGTIGSSGIATSDEDNPLSFVVYSQIATQLLPLVQKYKTTYNIKIVRLASSSNVSLEDVYVDGVESDFSLVGNKYTVEQQLDANGSIEVVFKDSTSLFPDAHNLVYEELYYVDGGVEYKVNKNHYSLTLNPINKNAEAEDDRNILGFKIELDSRYKAGVYIAKFRYFDSTTIYSLEFTKAPSSLANVVDIEYTSYSSDPAGEEQSFIPTAEDFETYIGFGVILKGILSTGDNEAIVINEVVSEDTSFPKYFDSTLHYEIVIGAEVIAKVNVAAFAALTGITTNYSYNNGYKEYTLNYFVQAEASSTPIEIEHTIIERSLPPIIVYKDGNLENPELISISREAYVTQIDINFGFPSSNYNKLIETNVYIGETEELYEYDEDEIYFGSSSFYEMMITTNLNHGKKRYEFILEREPGVFTDIGYIFIKKEEGTDAYLKDVIFASGASQNIINPRIFQCDEYGNVYDANGNPIYTTYSPMFYYDGIDYVGADIAGIQYFRIDGVVTQEDLEFYTPTFVVPAGATIQMYGESGWVDIVETDYLGDDVEEKIVQYRVTSEDGTDTVYYFITAIDRNYTVTLRFNLFYKGSSMMDYEDSPIGNKTIIINVKNFKLLEVDGEGEIEYAEPYTDGNGYIHYPFEDGIKDYVDTLNTHATLFYYPVGTHTNYLYTFGRNLTGGYSFTVIPPIYTGESSDLQKNGKRYSYSIYLITDDASGGPEDYPWLHDKYKLPEFDQDNYYSGKYFYIVGSTKQQIRNFAIVINEETLGNDWGLDDDYDTWN